MGVSSGCPNFLGAPLLSQERVKLRTSNSAGTFTGSTRTNGRYNFGQNEMLAYPVLRDRRYRRLLRYIAVQKLRIVGYIADDADVTIYRDSHESHDTIERPK